MYCLNRDKFVQGTPKLIPEQFNNETIEKGGELDR